MINVTLLGTAATMPLPERALTAAVLAYKGHSVLFDCGEGTQTAARKAHVSLMKTELIALTHYHGDHIFGLPGLLQTMGCLGRAQPLYLTGPAGIEETMAPLLSLTGQLPFRVVLLSAEDLSARLSEIFPAWGKEVFLTAFPTSHRVDSCGYSFSLRRAGKFRPERAEELGVPKPVWSFLQRGEPVILDDGKRIDPEDVLGPERRGLKVVFSGDTAPCKTLREAAASADLLICDATYGDSEHSAQAEKYGHSTFRQAALLAAEAGVRELWLTHFSQIMDDPEDYLPAAREVFCGSVCGEDGLSLKLEFTD